MDGQGCAQVQRWLLAEVNHSSLTRMTQISHEEHLSPLDQSRIRLPSHEESELFFSVWFLAHFVSLNRDQFCRFHPLHLRIHKVTSSLTADHIQSLHLALSPLHHCWLTVQTLTILQEGSSFLVRCIPNQKGDRKFWGTFRWGRPAKLALRPPAMLT